MTRACFMCAVKGAGQHWVQVPPGNWTAPPGGNRSGGRGDEAVGAFGVYETCSLHPWRQVSILSAAALNRRNY
jgi:hypothetical protein